MAKKDRKGLDNRERSGSGRIHKKRSDTYVAQGIRIEICGKVRSGGQSSAQCSSAKV